MDKRKKGSHVEVILSFIIFIGFLLFLFLVIQPAIRKPTDKQNLFDNLKMKLIDEISADVTSYTLNIDWDNSGCSSSGLSCIKIESPVLKNAFVKESGTYYNLTYLSIDCAGVCEGSFTVYHSDVFENTKDSSCTGTDRDCYSIGFLVTKRQIFKSRIIELKKSYQENREDTKSLLGIPDGTEFGFIFRYFEGEEEKEIFPINIPDISKDANFYVEEIPITYVDDDPAIKKYGFIEVKLW